MDFDLDQLAQYGPGELAAALRAGQVDAVTLVQAYGARIEALDHRFNAFLHVDIDGALVAAEASDERRARGEALSDFDGVPFAVKDNLDVAQMPTTCGFGFARQRVAVQDATAVAALKRLGWIVLGKTHMPEGAIGGAGHNKSFGRADNPWRHGHAAGGSSSGSAVAVAAGLAPMALGSDSLGSLRIPASYCGIAAIKPTFGLVPTRGLHHLSPSLDTLGPMTRHVSDLAPILSALALYDPESLKARPLAWRAASRRGVKGLRLGIAGAIEGRTFDSDLAHHLDGLAGRLRAAGAEIIEIDLSGFDLLRLTRRCLVVCEVEGALQLESDLADHAPDFPGPLMDMLTYGSRLPAVQVARARLELDQAGARLRSILADLDALILPTTDGPAFAATREVPRGQADLIALANAAGVPALAMPLALNGQGLPLSIQILGSDGADGDVIRIAELVAALIKPIGLPGDH